MTGIGIDKVNPRVVGEFGTARFGRLLWPCRDLNLNHVWLSAIGDARNVGAAAIRSASAFIEDAAVLAVAPVYSAQPWHCSPG
jgi:hypothetical protein